METEAAEAGGETLAVRIWLPDEPGRLGVVAGRLGNLGANVVGLEVLERSGGMAIDELRVEMPVRGGSEALARTLSDVPDLRVEDVRPLRPGCPERSLEVIAAAEALLETANATATIAALVGLTEELFDFDWSALVDLRARTCLQRTGDGPSLDWLLAFVSGVLSTPGGAETSGSGVIAGSLVDSGLILCLGRAVAFRRRERRELDMLARAADRMCRPLRADRVPTAWVNRPLPLRP